MMKKKDILFLCQYFYPEYNSSATLPWDTARALKKAGFSVGVLCGYPQEYSNKNKVPVKEKRKGISIRRLRYLQLSRNKKVGRFVNYFSFTVAILLHLTKIRKYKYVMVYSNPPILPVAAILANKLFKTKIIFVCYDVYPEIAYTFGSLSEKGMIAKCMCWINDCLFKKAVRVVALTDEMKEFLVSHRKGISDDQIVVIPNWAHEKANDSALKNYVEFGYTADDFIVSYFGNMGTCQDMDTILEAIKLLDGIDNIHFLIAGHGNKKELVIRQTKGMENVQVLDFLTGEKFSRALSICSCGIVSLEKGLTGMCAPSKYYSYLQSGVPVIAITEKSSYLAKEIEQYSIGNSVVNGNGKLLALYIKKMAYNRLEQEKMAERAKNLYQRKYDKQKGLKKYITLYRMLGSDEV